MFMNNEKADLDLETIFKFEQNKEKIFLTVKNEQELLRIIETKIIELLGFNNTKEYNKINIVERTRLTKEILKFIILNIVLKKAIINTNTLYTIKVSPFLKSSYYYIINDIEANDKDISNKVPNGITIDKITELEYNIKNKDM